MKILITGATGYIGHAIVKTAITYGYKVNILVRQTDGRNVPRDPAITCFAGDVTNMASIAEAMNGCSAVIHAAGITRLYSSDREIFYRVNVEGTRNILACAAAMEVKRFVYTSSCAVLGPSFRDPVTESDPRVTPFENDYEISKYAAEELVREYCRKGLYGVIVSPSRVYGPGLNTDGNPITNFIQKMLRRKFAFVPSALNVSGNYVFVEDVVQGHFLALNKGRAGEKYNLGGENASYARFFETIRHKANSRIIFIPLSKFLLQGISILEMTGCLFTRRQTHLSPSVINRLYQNRDVCSNKAVNELGYKITTLEEGIHKTISHIKGHYYEEQRQVRFSNGSSERIGEVPLR